MAAVARISNSPVLNSKAMSSPKSAKRSHIKPEDTSSTSRPATPQRNEEKPRVPSIVKPEDNRSSADEKDNVASTTNAPLAPPPRPNNADGSSNNHDGPGPNGGSHFSKEPNPFENAFGAPSETPGKTQLPGVTSFTSPAPLLGANTPGWPGSLRSGPLSPAMLTGPAGSNDYFNSDHHFAGSFPTPNESSLRTGLTPGGGGSMFPQPSPNSQAIFNAMQSGGATPGTLDFHRTAMHARAASHNTNQFNALNGATSQPQDPNIQPNLDSKGFPGQQSQQHQQQQQQQQQHQQQHQQHQQQQQQHQQQQQQHQQDQFEQHDANDAANGLYMLAQAKSINRNQPQSYPAPQQQPQMNYMPNAPQMGGQMQHQDNRAAKNSVGSNLSGSTHGEGNLSDSGNSEQAKAPQGRGRGGKKGSNTKNANGRRKAEDTPSKGANKRQKGNNGSVNNMDTDMDMGQDDDMSDDEPEPTHGADGKKLTDEEKRKNFLERNRIAALKCRQRKKQWLANLQHKVEMFSTENDALAATVTQLREEIVGLKTLLLAHKDCQVSQAQGISGMAMQNVTGDPQQYGNPYGMGMQGMQHSMSQANMQRR